MPHHANTLRHAIYTAHCSHATLPVKSQIAQWVDRWFAWMFCLGSAYRDYAHFVAEEEALAQALSSHLASCGIAHDQVGHILGHIDEQIIVLHERLAEDLMAVMRSDPAAKSSHEVISSYPGFFAIAVHRLAHQLWKLEVAILPRMMSEYIHSATGIDIHPGAEIGRRCFMDHGTGVVIGETAIIGDDVTIYQGVTLGALSVSKEDSDIKRHPTIGHKVTIYANATILGGRTVVGDGAVIGGNVWITQSVPPRSLVYHKSEVIIKNQAPFPNPLDFII